MMAGTVHHPRAKSHSVVGVGREAATIDGGRRRVGTQKYASRIW